MSQKITATLLRGISYTFANLKFDIGVAKPVTAEIADALEEKTHEVTIAETGETEQRPYFEITRPEVAEVEGETAEGETAEGETKPQGRTRAR